MDRLVYKKGMLDSDQETVAASQAKMGQLTERIDGEKRVDAVYLWTSRV